MGRRVQAHGLNKLQSFVHQGGAVDGNLGTHAPSWDGTGRPPGHIPELLPPSAVKGATGAGKDQAPDLPPVPAASQALENGRVFRVHRDDLCPILVRRIHHQLPAHTRVSLVGKANPLSPLDGSQGGLQTHHAHHGR